MELTRRAGFHLVYLAFLAMPWLNRLPEPKDLAWTALAVAIFVPVHMSSYARGTRRYLAAVAVMTALACATAFLPVVNGVFAIYAAGQAGYQSRKSFATAAFLLSLGAFAVVSLSIGRWPLEVGFAAFMAVIIWVTCLHDAEQRTEAEQIARARELDRQEAHTVERERISRDLHDSLGYTLSLISLKADLALKVLGSDASRAAQEVNDIRDHSRRALDDVRAVLAGLQTTSIGGELDNARSALATAGVTLSVEGEPPILRPAAETAVAFAVREAATNVIRHSTAERVAIRFITGDDTATVIIQDDGNGADLQEGQGLRGLRARIESVGGDVWYDFAGRGHISITVPRTMEP